MFMRPYLLIGVVAASVCVAALVGCGAGGSAGPQTRVVPTGTSEVGGEIVQVAETGAYREELGKGLGDVVWTVVTDTTGISGEATAREVVLGTIKARGRELAAIDYSALSLEAFKGVTGQLKLGEDSFAGGEARVEYVGTQGGQVRWLLYDYRGPEIPQLPERPQVFRWVEVYALYSVGDGRVTRLVATIRGEAQE